MCSFSKTTPPPGCLVFIYPKCLSREEREETLSKEEKSRFILPARKQDYIVNKGAVTAVYFRMKVKKVNRCVQKCQQALKNRKEAAVRRIILKVFVSHGFERGPLLGLSGSNFSAVLSSKCSFVSAAFHIDVS